MMTPERITALASDIRDGLASRSGYASAALTALTDELLRYQAEREGTTGVPTHEGRYWCEARAARYQWREVFRWHRGQWTELRLSSWETAPPAITITRYWRLPGETYTPVGK